MGVTYPPSDLLVQGSSTHHALFTPGHRCPDLLLANIHNPLNSTARKRLYSLIWYGKFVVLLLGGNGRWKDVKSDSYRDLASLWRIRDLQSLGAGVGESESVYEHEYAADWVKAGDDDDGGVAVVVRPDLYVGYVGSEWEGYLGTILGR